MTKKTDKTRVSITMTKPYVKALDSLVEVGLYFTRGEIVLEALRHFLKGYGLKPFVTPESIPE